MVLSICVLLSHSSLSFSVDSWDSNDFNKVTALKRWFKTMTKYLKDLHIKARKIVLVLPVGSRKVKTTYKWHQIPGLTSVGINAGNFTRDANS